MWMMMDNNNDPGRDQFKPPPDLFIGRKLRPLMPRPISCCSAATNHPYSTPPCCCSRNPKTLPWNHPLAAPLVSTRWNPTPEQLQALEEMYRRGIRTPSAEQIQQIAAKLGRFGKIEGKNVFYWFQNHKARERQKKRRQLELLAAKKMHHATAAAAHPSDTKPAGLSRRYVENEKVPIPSKCSTPSEDSASMHGAEIAGKDGWAHKEVGNENCWQLDLSSCSNNNSSINAITPHKTTGQENTNPYVPLTLNHNEENQTLQLFPTGSIAAAHGLSIPTRITPREFIEFLPIKT